MRFWVMLGGLLLAAPFLSGCVYVAFVGGLTPVLDPHKSYYDQYFKDGSAANSGSSSGGNSGGYYHQYPTPKKQAMDHGIEIEMLQQKTGMSETAARRFFALIRVDGFEHVDFALAKASQLQQELQLTPAEFRFLLQALDQRLAFNSEAHLDVLMSVALKICQNIGYNNVAGMKTVLIYTIQFVRLNRSIQDHLYGGSAA